jgi:hypothetical protein
LAAALWIGIKQMLVARVVIRDRMLKTIQRCRPEFHPIEIVAQAL